MNNFKGYGDRGGDNVVRRKSASLQALTSPIIDTTKPLGTAERIGGKISRDLVNGSSSCNSARGSKSSGLQVNIICIFSKIHIQVNR